MPSRWSALVECHRWGGISNRCAGRAGFFDVMQAQQEIEMNQDRFEGNWKQFGGKVEEQ